MTRETSCVSAAHRLEAAGPRVRRQVAREARERAACGFVSKEISDHGDGGKRDAVSGKRRNAADDGHASVSLPASPSPISPASATQEGHLPKTKLAARQAQGTHRTARVAFRTASIRARAPSARACDRVAASATGITTAANATAPSVAPTNTVISARVGPSAAPTNAISVTSPNPIASRFVTTSPNHPTIAIRPAPAHAPTSASYGVANT